jgi:hypothetical protein
MYPSPLRHKLLQVNTDLRAEFQVFSEFANSKNQGGGKFEHELDTHVVPAEGESHPNEGSYGNKEVGSAISNVFAVHANHTRGSYGKN